MPRAVNWTITALVGALLIALVFTLGYVSNGGDATVGTFTPPTSSDQTDQNSAAFDTFQQIMDILRRDYVDPDLLDDQQLYDAAINGLVDSLSDTGTFYIDPTSFQISIGPSGKFEGIGATVSQEDNDIVIVRPFPNSPAERSGILAGDVIIAVDGESTAGWTVDKAVLRIRGERGTQVTLSVRHLDGVEEEITITRDEIQVDSVTATPPGGILRDANGDEVPNLTYVRISDFSQRTPGELEPIVREAQESGQAGLILDLRGNPGGLLDETVQTADLFLDGGVILSEIDRDGNERVFRARPGGAATTIPIVILMNRFSASASEVLAASLRDNDRAIIVGETSFGKGTVNLARELNDGGALFVTIGRWFTPDGVLIDGVGIRPDVEVAFTPGVDDPLEDPQLLRAIEHLQNLQASEALEPASALP